MINNPIIHKLFKDHRKKTNRVVVFSSRPFPNILKYRDHRWNLSTIWKTTLLKALVEEFSYQFYKQTYGCTMWGPLLVTSNIYLTKLEKDQVRPLKPKFYCRFLDDVISRRLRNTHDSLFEKLSSYYEKINFSIETNPEKFLDTRLLLENDKNWSLPKSH